MFKGMFNTVLPFKGMFIADMQVVLKAKWNFMPRRSPGIVLFTSSRSGENVGDLAHQVDMRPGEGAVARGKLHGDCGYFPPNHVTRITVIDPVVPGSSGRL